MNIMIRHSPFPGMDPYVERLWGTFHTTAVTELMGVLNDRLAPGLVAVSEERIVIEDDALAYRRDAYPDVRVVQLRDGSPRQSVDEGGAVVAEPELVDLAPDPYRQVYVQIVDAKAGGKVVTVIELVSPTNKRPGKARELYRKKQREVSRSEASLVEVDLVRRGRPTTLAARRVAFDRATEPYHVSVRRGYRRTNLEVYRLGLRDRLPRLRLPLRPNDPDIVIDLQSLVAEAYRRCRLAELIDYDKPADPPLEPADAAWAAEQIRRWRADAPAPASS